MSRCSNGLKKSSFINVILYFITITFSYIMILFVFVCFFSLSTCILRIRHYFLMCRYTPFSCFIFLIILIWTQCTLVFLTLYVNKPPKLSFSIALQLPHSMNILYKWTKKKEHVEWIIRKYYADNFMFLTDKRLFIEINTNTKNHPYSSKYNVSLNEAIK